MARRYYSTNAVSTTLTAGISNSVTTIAVAATTGFPGSTPYTLIIDPDTASEEVVEVTGVAGLNLTVTRGVDGSSGVAHSTGAVVRHGVSARDFDEPNAHVNNSTTAHGLTIADVVTLAGTQTLTNKTLTTPVISSISNTGTVTLPTATDTLVGRATTDTLTNKTLTSPTVNQPTLNLANTSPTADGGIGWAQSTDSLQVGDGTNSKPIHLGAWQSYTPTVYNWTGGDLSGAYVRVGNTVHFRAKFSTNFSSTHSGTFEMSLPVTSSSNSPVLIGGATVYIWSTSAYYVGWVARISTTRVNVWLPNPTATTDGEKTTVTGSKPVVFSAGGDYVEVAGTYEAA